MGLATVKVDQGGGGDNRVWDHYADAGEDSVPLPDDYVQSVSTEGSGRASAVGYIDPKNEGKAAAGEKRIYARDAETGETVAEIWLKADGSIEMSASGGITINGVTIAGNGQISTPTGIDSPSVVAAGKELAGHTHTQPNDGAGDTQSPTGPNV
jgi:hypothetical protein